MTTERLIYRSSPSSFGRFLDPDTSDGYVELIKDRLRQFTGDLKYDVVTGDELCTLHVTRVQELHESFVEVVAEWVVEFPAGTESELVTGDDGRLKVKRVTT